MKSHDTDRKKAILVLGMHRSGTSVLTRIINLLGVDLGGNLLPPGDDNPRGFWEHAEAVAIHEELLQSLDRSWHDTRAMPENWAATPAASRAKERIAALIARDFNGSRLWAVKDPRLCRLVPLWVEVASAIGFDVCALFAMRHPAEVVSSLFVRDGLATESMELSWLEHFAEAEYSTRSLPRSLVLYEDLLSDWRSVLLKVAVELGLNWPKDVKFAASSIDGFLSKGNKHHVAEDPGLGSLALGLPRDLYAQCSACAHDQEPDWGGVSELVDTYRRVAPLFLGDIAERADEAGRLLVKLHGAEDALRDKDASMSSYGEMNRDNERKIYGLLETVHGKDIHIQSREDVIRGKDLEIQRRDEVIHDKEKEIRNRDEVIRCKEAEFRVRDETIRRLESQMVESRTDLLARDKTVAEMEFRLAIQDGQVQITNERIQRKDEVIRNGDETIRRLESQLAESRADLLARDKVVAEMESRLAVQDGQVQMTSEHIQRKDEAIRNRDETIRRLEDQLEKFRTESAARNELVPILESKLVDQQDEIRALKENNHNKAETAERREKAIQRGENRVSTLAEERRRQDEVIEMLRAQADVQAQQIEEMSRNAEAMHSKLCMLTNQLQVSHTQVRDMESSRSWRMTKPMRAFKLALIARKLSKSNKVAGLESSRPAQKDPVQRGDQPFVHGSHANVSDVHMAPLLSQDVGPTPSLVTPGFALRGNLLPIVILTTPHCTYVAKEIEDALRRVGIKSRIIYDMPGAGYDDVPHFVICPQMFERLPGLYVSFQMEQSVSSRWFTKEYMRQLENSFAIFDYSLVNIAKLQDMGLHAQQMYHIPVGYMQNYATTTDAEPALYDVIFYGDIQNARRREFIAELGNVCKVKVINDLFGAPLHAELARARLVVNIHYYAGALLETTRLWECLSLGKLVVSERAVDMDQHGDLAGLIDFVDVGDIAGMIERVNYWLSNEELRQQRLERNNKALQDMPDQFDAQFYRFLLATDNITFDEFWSVSGQRMKLPGDKVCLNLPEFTRRARSFDRDNRFGFVRFTGLRHRQGWVGCAMSYKLMIMLARQQGLSSVTICEDDVEFLQDFESRWPVIQKYLLATPNDWDVFSGLMADVHADTKIVSAYERNNIQFAVTDRLISMVFNVYNATTFDTIASWDERNRDVNTNTIDRYLERARSIRVLTTLPFLVGHKEELYSTLWGFQNAQYAGLIAASSALLANKVIEYDERELGS